MPALMAVSGLHHYLIREGLDGNGRWAEQRGLPVAEGHREGTRALRRTVEAAIDLGIESLTVYAFSTKH